MRPLDVDELAREFERLRTDPAETPAGLAAWEAFVAVAQRPADAGEAAAGISEDLLMFDVAAHEGGSPQVRLVRVVGLEDSDGDYVGSRTLECFLFYDDDALVPELRSGVVRAWLYPDVAPAGVAAFVEQATTTAAFRLLVALYEPTKIDATPP